MPQLLHNAVGSHCLPSAFPLTTGALGWDGTWVEKKLDGDGTWVEKKLDGDL